jgi:hypothetical protein
MKKAQLKSKFEIALSKKFMQGSQSNKNDKIPGFQTD